jgi:CarD family transcriptional regulator
MTLRVPTKKAKTAGLRPLAEGNVVSQALTTLTGRARVKRTMWSRRAQEYEAKINSGDLIAVTEVVRDLYRSEAQPEQSYSERQLYESALDRVVREVAAIERIDREAAIGILTKSLVKTAAAA